MVVFVYYALTHYLLWDNDDYAGCTFSRMEKEINIFSTNILISTFLTVFYFQKYLFLGFGTYKHFMLFRYLVESFKIFCFLLQHFLFSLSRVLFARCVASLLCAASCGLFYFIKAFSVMHGTDFCASSPYYYVFHGLIQPWRNFFLLSSTLPLFSFV